jgi:hypothetical protein
VGARPIQQLLQPEATGATYLQVTKWLKPSDSLLRCSEVYFGS